MIKTTGQFGEYAVAAELCRCGLVATTFTRNMPGFDILALNYSTKKSFRIQVKTVKSGEWSLDAKRFLNFDEELFNNGIQKITNRKNNDETDFFVFVKMDEKGDKFFILTENEIEEIVYQNYKSFLDKIDGIRPKNPKTTHTAVQEKDIVKFKVKGRWDIFFE
ncbi:MAG: hypothetical protein U9Q92_06025 [archaeon]|nr:hypothetical protein [archaeon]